MELKITVTIDRMLPHEEQEKRIEKVIKSIQKIAKEHGVTCTLLEVTIG